MKHNHANDRGHRTKRVVAVSATAALALAGVALATAPANAVTSTTPDLSKASSWAKVPTANFDGAATKLPGKSTSAFRLSNWVSDASMYGAAEQFETPAVNLAGPRGASAASYDTFTESFTLSAASYATQPDLSVEVSPDTNGNRAGGDLLLREEAGQKLSLTNFHLKAGATGDEASDWGYSTATIDFTKPVTIKYVALFNPDAAADIVKIYVNGSSTPLVTGSTFETYHAIDGNPAQTVNALNFRATSRKVALNDPDEAWTSPEISSDEYAALKGKGFYFSGLTYGVSNTEASNPIEFAVPTISGTPAVGETLTAGTDTDQIKAVTFKYQWLRNGAAIGNATKATYALTSSDFGKKISVKVTASKPGYISSTRTSAATAAVGIGTLDLTTPTNITGTAAVGSKLTAHIATSPIAVYTYQWWNGDAAIKGATASTYTVTPTDIGATLSVTATAKKTDFTTVPSRSAGVGPVVAGTLTVSTPTLTGTTKVGQKFTAKATATSGALLRYAFYADDELVQLSTSSTYVTTFDVAGAHLTVKVTALKAGYTTVTSASSAPSSAIR